MTPTSTAQDGWWERWRRDAIVLSSLLAVAAVLLIVPRADAGLKFSPPRTLSSAGQDASGAKVGVDSQGRARVIWSVFHGPIQTVRLGRDGIPGPVRDLGAGDGPQLAVDSEGQATVVWDESQPVGPPALKWVRVGADGIAGEVENLPADGANPRVAADLQGRATVAWQTSGGSGFGERIQALRLAADGTPGPVHTLSEELQDVALSDVAVDPRGRATMVWQHLDPPSGDERVQAVSLDADSSPGPVHTLSKAGASRARNPQVATDSKGRATVVWEQRAGKHGGGRKTVQAVRLGADGNPGVARTLSKSRAAGGAQVGVDAKGRATVAWQRGPRSKGLRIQSVRLGAGGTPGRLNTISKAQAYRPEVAVDGKGRAIVVWERYWRRETGIQARRLGADGSPEAVRTLFRGRQDAYDADIAVDPKGRPTVVWQQTPYDGEPKSRIQFAQGRDRR